MVIIEGIKKFKRFGTGSKLDEIAMAPIDFLAKIYKGKARDLGIGHTGHIP